jgi:hypothetical protein
MRIFSALMAALVLGLVAGCENEPAQTQVKADPLPADLFVSTAPDGAVDVVAAKTSAKDGQSVVIKGVIAGQKEPLAANRAIMTVADAGLPTCDKSPMDKCPTPWDACCEPKEEIAAKTISVQVVGSDNQPLKAGLNGASGLAPMKHVVVAGTVKAPTSDTIVIQAQRIYVAP